MSELMEKMHPTMTSTTHGTASWYCFHVSRFTPGRKAIAKPRTATTVTFSAGIHVPAIHRTGNRMTNANAFLSWRVGAPALSVCSMMPSSWVRGKCSGGKALVTKNQQTGTMTMETGMPTAIHSR